MNCRACRSDRLDPVFSMDPMPLAGAFTATAELALALPKFPLTWLLCDDCGLVNVEPDIPDDVIYRTYSYAASTVPGLVRHHAEFAKVLAERYGAKVRLLEIGCNDGVLLNQLPKTWDLIGVDPSDVAAIAQPRPYTVYNMPFARSLEYLPEGTFDVVTSSNSFAHFSDIAGAFEGITHILKPDGELWIEVHALEATLLSGQWDTVYHEHKVEWSMDALLYNGALRGLRYCCSEYLPLHGGLWRAHFIYDGEVRQMGTRRRDFSALQAAYDNRAAVRADVAYGAAARATVYLNQVPTGVQYIIDGSPLRAGKFVPGIGIPVLPPGVFDADPPGRTLITAWNHADDIRRRHPDYDGWVSAW